MWELRATLRNPLSGAERDKIHDILDPKKIVGEESEHDGVVIWSRNIFDESLWNLRVILRDPLSDKERDQLRRIFEPRGIEDEFYGPFESVPETSLELEKALEGDRDAALDMWRIVERYPEDPDAIVWTRGVARRILKAEKSKLDPNRRPDAILEAVGLKAEARGRPANKHRRLRDLIEVTDGFLEDLPRSKRNERIYMEIRRQAKRDLDEKDPEHRFFYDYSEAELADFADSDNGLTDHKLMKLVSEQRKRLRRANS